MPTTKESEVLIPAGDSLLNTRQTAKALGVSERTVIRWRCEKVNLDYVRVGHQARYEPEVVKAFKESQTIHVSSFPFDSRQRDDR